MPVGEIKFMRIPVTGVKCEGCSEDLPFGAWAHYQPDSKKAVCIDCGAKRGWTDKERAMQLIRKRELQEDIKALRARQKIEADALYLLTQQVDVHRFGECWLDLDRQLHKLMDTVRSYLDKVATPEEKDALTKVFDAIRETQELQKEVSQELEMRLYLLDRSARRKKHLEKLVDEEATQETIRVSE